MAAVYGLSPGVWNTDMTYVSSDNDCLQKLEQVLFNNSHHYTQFYDATGKLNSGLTGDVMVSLGDYRQCHLLPESRYCLADIVTNQQLPGSVNMSVVRLVWGLCVVNVCNASTLQDNIDLLIHKILNIDWVFPQTVNVNCSQDLPLSTAFWATIVVLLVLLVLVVLGTLLDVQYRYTACMRWDLLYHVSSSSRQLIGQREGHVTWTTVDSSTECLAVETDGDGNSSTGSGIQTPPNTQLLVQAFQYQPGVLVRIGQCFSVVTNIESIVSRPATSSLASLDALRVLSLSLIILGQTALTAYQSANTVNRDDVVKYSERIDWQLITNSHCAIDTFFLISGLLVVYNALANNNNNNNNCRRVVVRYVHRLLRLTPTISMVMLFWLNVTPYVSRGPLWFKLQQRINNESRYWWSTLLYVNNFYPSQLHNSCMSWLWYVAADFQLFCFTPVLLFLISRNKTAIAIGVPLVASIIVTAALIGSYNLDVNLTAPLIGQNHSSLTYESIVFDKPYCRLSAYIVGAWLGYKLHCDKTRQVRIRRVVAVIGWFVCLSLVVATLYATYPAFIGQQLYVAGNVIYGALCHFMWALAMSWVVYCCVHRCAGPVGFVLSWRLWVPLGKLTFSAFVCHGVCLSVFFYSQQTPLVFSFISMCSIYLSMLVVTYMCSLLVVLLVELPVQNIERLLRS